MLSCTCVYAAPLEFVVTHDSLVIHGNRDFFNLTIETNGVISQLMGQRQWLPSMLVLFLEILLVALSLCSIREKDLTYT